MSSHFRRLPIRQKHGEIVSTELPATTLVLLSLLRYFPKDLDFMHVP